MEMFITKPGYPDWLKCRCLRRDHRECAKKAALEYARNNGVSAYYFYVHATNPGPGWYWSVSVPGCDYDKIDPDGTIIHIRMIYEEEVGWVREWVDRVTNPYKDEVLKREPVTI